MKRILIVDDDPSMLVTLKTCLKQNFPEYKIHVANGVNNAKKVLVMFPNIELIITDIFMPELLGTELIKFVKSEHAGIPIIAASAGKISKNGVIDWTPEEILNLTKELGSDAVIPKPYCFDKIISTVKEFI